MSNGLYNIIITTLCGLIVFSGLLSALTRIDKFGIILQKYPTLRKGFILAMLTITMITFVSMVIYHWSEFGNVRVEVLTVGILSIETLFLYLILRQPIKVPANKMSETEALGDNNENKMLNGVGKCINKPNMPSEELINRMRQHLQKWIDSKEYLNHKVDIDTVARAVYTNRTYISRFILVEFGYNFPGFINSLRLNHAKILLAEGDENLTILKIAELSGFTSSTYFCRLFYKAERVNPSKWREMNRADKNKS